MDRKLAHIEKIIDIQPIEGADNILVAKILGWSVVIAKRDNFQIGDKVVYIECDSIVPSTNPVFEFLKDRKYRVRIIKLRKQVSMGLVLPLSILPNKRWKEGQDVTDVLGIIKYDPQAEKEDKELDVRLKNPFVKFMSRFGWFRKLFLKKTSGGFPSWISKTDEERIQNIPELLYNERDTPFEVTEKLDGQSATYFLKKNGNKYEFGVCSRNLRINTPNQTSYWKVAREYDIETILKSLIGDFDYVVLQGEIIGEGIQENKYKVQGLRLFAFNLIFPDGKRNAFEIQYSLSRFGVETVPLLSTDFFLSGTMDENVDRSNGESVVIKGVMREGIVLRNNERGLSFKIISPKFLLKNDE